jgi:hypothetical protein
MGHLGWTQACAREAAGSLSWTGRRQVEQAFATRIACGAVACVRCKTTPFVDHPSISKLRAYIRSQEAGAQKRFF